MDLQHTQSEQTRAVGLLWLCVLSAAPLLCNGAADNTAPQQCQLKGSKAHFMFLLFLGNNCYKSV